MPDGLGNGLDFFLDGIAEGERTPVGYLHKRPNADVPMSVRAMKASAVQFLTKPVRHQELLEAIHRTIERGPPVVPGEVAVRLIDPTLTR
jgi:FixJ family two-component response regulator